MASGFGDCHPLVIIVTVEVTVAVLLSIGLINFDQRQCTVTQECVHDAMYGQEGELLPSICKCHAQDQHGKRKAGLRRIKNKGTRRFTNVIQVNALR